MFPTPNKNVYFHMFKDLWDHVNSIFGIYSSDRIDVGVRYSVIDGIVKEFIEDYLLDEIFGYGVKKTDVTKYYIPWRRYINNTDFIMADMYSDYCKRELNITMPYFEVGKGEVFYSITNRGIMFVKINGELNEQNNNIGFGENT